MLDHDLADLYGVTTKRLKEQIRRNLKRFPGDFMFELTWDEVMTLPSRSQIATLKKGKNIKYLPFVFTEQGVAMLSSVLNSERAIQVNIQIMRTFSRLKEFLLTNKELSFRLEALEKKFGEHDEKIRVVFEAIKRLLQPEVEPPKPKIGFHPIK